MKQNPRATRPYAPSFINQFMNFIERLPLPYWLTYLALFFLQSLLTHAVAWIARLAAGFHVQPDPVRFSALAVGTAGIHDPFEPGGAGGPGRFQPAPGGWTSSGWSG